MMKKSLMNKQERLRLLKRNQCLKKKTIELSTLCGIDAMIICLDNNGEITDTWPDKKTQIQSVINRYRNYMMISERETEKEMIRVKKKKKGRPSILSKNPSLDERSFEDQGVLSEKELREYEMELEKLIQNPCFDDGLEGFSAKELEEFEMELESNNNRRGGGKEECLIEENPSFASTELNEDPLIVLNFDTMMSSKFSENPSFASSSSSYSGCLIDETEGFLWDHQNNSDSELVVMGCSNSSSWSLSPSLHASASAAVASSCYCSTEFPVEGNFDDDDNNQAYGWLALPTVEELLSMCTPAVDDESYELS